MRKPFNKFSAAKKFFHIFFLLCFSAPIFAADTISFPLPAYVKYQKNPLLLVWPPFFAGANSAPYGHLEVELFSETLPLVVPVLPPPAPLIPNEVFSGEDLYLSLIRDKALLWRHFFEANKLLNQPYEHLHIDSRRFHSYNELLMRSAVPFDVLADIESLITDPRAKELLDNLAPIDESQIASEAHLENNDLVLGNSGKTHKNQTDDRAGQAAEWGFDVRSIVSNCSTFSVNVARCIEQNIS